MLPPLADVLLRNHLKKVFCPSPPEADKFLCWELVSTPRNTIVCLWIEPRSRLDLEPKSHF